MFKAKKTIIFFIVFSSFLMSNTDKAGFTYIKESFSDKLNFQISSDNNKVANDLADYVSSNFEISDERDFTW